MWEETGVGRTFFPEAELSPHPCAVTWAARGQMHRVWGVQTDLPAVWDPGNLGAHLGTMALGGAGFQDPNPVALWC